MTAAPESGPGAICLKSATLTCRILPNPAFPAPYASAAPRSSAAPPARPRRVLLVEDDDLIRSFERAVLLECGCEVFEATNGAEALDLIAVAESNGAPPDVIVLDINMPVLDGVGFARAYAARRERALDSPSAAPIIVTTAAGGAGLYGQFVGAAESFSKPFDLDDLCLAIERILQS